LVNKDGKYDIKKYFETSGGMKNIVIFFLKHSGGCGIIKNREEKMFQVFFVGNSDRSKKQ
jgi:hypothetical protein